MIALLLAAALQASPAPPPPPPAFHSYDELIIYFGPGPTDIRVQSKPAINEAVRQIALYSPRRILVSSHADALGSTDGELALSAERAKILRDLLVKAGAPPERIVLAPHGGSQPAVAKTGKGPQPLNDRVVVILKEITLPAR